jgi:hypothetical protein
LNVSPHDASASLSRGVCRAELNDPADTEAALRREAKSADGPRAPWRQTAALYYMAVRRRLAGDKSGSMELIEKAAAAHAVTELQWYESELRVRLASGKISASQGSKAAAWRDNLPQPPKSGL